MERKVMLKEILVQIFQLSIFYFVARYFWGNEQWYQDKTKEMVFFLLVSILIIIIGLLFNSFGSPIILHIKQLNKKFEGTQTNFSIKGSRKTIQDERIVKVRIQLNRKYSVWGNFVVFLLKNIDYRITIKPDRFGVKLQLVNDLNFNNTIISSTVEGIEFDVAEYIESTLNVNSQCEVFQDFEYIVIEDTSNFSAGGMFVVAPKLTCRGIKSRILQVFIVSKVEQHIINFVRG